MNTQSGNKLKLSSKDKLVERENIFSIPPCLPFLDTLANALLDGHLFGNFDIRKNADLLARTTIYLPTRRAARGLSLALLLEMEKRYEKRAILLPDIRTIGDVDDEEFSLGLTSDVTLDIGKPINPQKRQLTLAKLAKSWSEALRSEQRNLFEAEEIVLPSSSADALKLATNVASFMDQFETEGVSWSALENIQDDEYQQWWQLTLAFLKIVMHQWPQYLQENGEINPAAFRNRHTQYRISQLEQIAQKGPVIIAGTTGSIPATADLINAIANQKNGAVVLPGFDKKIPIEIFDQIKMGVEINGENIFSTHPQFGLVRLVAQLGLHPNQVNDFLHVNEKLSVREDLLNVSLLPSERSAEWLDYRNNYSENEIESAFENVTIINAPTEREEALAIALLFRQALETPDKSAALVTPDRKLARRVSSELARYGIQIDDSGGASLLIAPCAVFLRNLLKCIFEPADSVSLSAFFKSEFLLLGQDQSTANSLGELLELMLVRDALELPNLQKLASSVEEILDALPDQKYAPAILQNLSESQKDNLLNFANSISNALAEFFEFVEKSGGIFIDRLFVQLKKALVNLNLNEANNPEIFSTTQGQELSNFLNSYNNLDCSSFPLEPIDVLAVVETLLSEKFIRNPERTHPRLQIFGPLEARLQSVDLVVLGGMNENSWPQLSRNDPFLNRPMRAELTLPLPERRIGLAAHDFQQLMGMQEVAVTRSARSENAPTVASRWVQRLTTFLGEEQARKLTLRGNKILQWTEILDLPDADIASAERPYPNPPVEARPKKLSITDIENWIRDPYAVYSKHILKVRPLPPLKRKTDAAVKGTLYHEILAEFVQGWKGTIDENAYENFFEIADKAFENIKLADEVKAVWRPRFNNVASDFLEYEKSSREHIKESHCEVSVSEGMKIGASDFYITGRADRINLLKDGTLQVIDYKTGSTLSVKEVKTLSPQLSLEGLLAQKGRFENIKAASVSSLNYIQLKEGNFADKDMTAKDAASDIIEKVEKNLIEHVAAYENEEQGYISRYAPKFEQNKSGDYDHLARVREWSIGEEASEGDYE